jgi:prolipoprotein diacylglyceryltransferase
MRNHDLFSFAPPLKAAFFLSSRFGRLGNFIDSRLLSKKLQETAIVKKLCPWYFLGHMRPW